MNRKLTILIAIVIIVAGGALALVLINKSNDDDSKKTNSQQSNSQTVIKVGTIECLPLAEAATTQNASCAVGLKQDENTAYALQASDPTLTGSIPSGQRVQVTGTLVQNTSDVNAAGVIQVTNIEKL